MSGIKLSKEFGVNPSIQVCHCCGKDMGLFLFGTSFKKDGKVAQAPMKMSNGDICDDCKKVINEGGTFFIEVRDGEAEFSPENPYRTGRLIAIKTEKAKEMFPTCQAINYMEQSMFEPLFGEALKESNKE